MSGFIVVAKKRNHNKGSVETIYYSHMSDRAHVVYVKDKEFIHDELPDLHHAQIARDEMLSVAEDVVIHRI